MAGHGGARRGAGAKKKSLASVTTVAERVKNPTTGELIAAVPDDALEEVLRALPENVTAHQLLNAVIQSPRIPAPIRMHAAAKVLPYEVAKPATTIKDGPAEPSIHDGARDKLRNKLDRLSGPGTASEASSKPH